MNLSVIGLGYVGLTNALYLASHHRIAGFDIDYNKINLLNEGKEYLGEEYLQGYLDKFKSQLFFSDDYQKVIAFGEVILIAVPTPEAQDGSCDLTALFSSCEHVANYAKPSVKLVIRSTVPPGTNEKVRLFFKEKGREDIDVISMPEFLALGSAMTDMMEPSRVVVGTTNLKNKSWIQKMFAYSEKTPFLFTNPQTAELIKYASNSLLATKVSFINEMSQVAEVVGANIDEVVLGMGLDPRIGSSFLKPGVGFGGSCFPKDLRALQKLSNDHQLGALLLSATLKTNLQQTKRFTQRILDRFDGNIKGKKIAVLGLSYKGSTSDVRNSPAFTVVDMLTDQEAIIFAYDKRATFDFFECRGEKPCLAYAVELADALIDADCAVIINDASEIKKLKPKDWIKLMKTPIVFDGRNLFEPTKMDGVEYHSVGRPTHK
jgi:UDPglucose 6-dehydrogenase